MCTCAVAGGNVACCCLKFPLLCMHTDAQSCCRAFMGWASTSLLGYRRWHCPSSLLTREKHTDAHTHGTWVLSNNGASAHHEGWWSCWWCVAVPPRPQNLIAQSQSGTGKTAAFVLTMLTRVDGSLPYPQVGMGIPLPEAACNIMPPSSPPTHCSGHLPLPDL